MTLEESNPHFQTVGSPAEAAEVVGFRPRLPTYTAGYSLNSLRIWSRDHRMRDVPIGERVVEAHYGAFVVSQSKPGRHRARAAALSTSYGTTAREIRVAGNEGRAYDLGPDVPEDDPDGRMPSVVAWCEGDYFYLVASGELEADELLPVAASLFGS